MQSQCGEPSRCLALLLSLVAIAAAFTSRAAANEPKTDEALARISDSLSEFVDENQISGAVTLVAHRGRIVHHEAIGFADLRPRERMQKGSLFCVASMTKPITATALMILVDEAKLSLDDPVAKYIPAFAEVKLKDGSRPRREITIRDLLTHTSGLVGSQQNEGTLAETVEKLAERPLGFEPGSKWQYGPGLTVCGRVVEIVAQQPFETFLDERIFTPLRMKETTFHPTEGQQRRIVKLYEPAKDGTGLEPATHWLRELSDDRSPNPSGGLFSTAADMARFYQMVLNGGELEGRRILSRGAVAEMTRIQTGDLEVGFTPGNGWGLGWCVIREPQGITRMLSPSTHGHGGAFGTQGWVDPERQTIFVLMIQRTNFGNSDGSSIREAFQELAVQALEQD
jgi:CubicO group peptidase (beta-lactamase class C family)